VLARGVHRGQSVRVAGYEQSGKRSAAADERPWIIATRVMLAAVGALLVVLIVTGVMLIFQYRPDVSPEYARVQGISQHLRVRTVHRDASRLLFPTFAALFFAAAGLALVRHRPARLAWPILAGVMVLATTFTGYLLPWDQLAFWSVTVGQNISGYRRILFHHNIKYVLLGNNEVGPSTLARWVWVHAAALTFILVVLLIVIAIQTRTPKSRCNRLAPSDR